MDNPQYSAKGRIKQVFYRPYSPERLNNIKKLIENFEQQGMTKYYAILVDGEVCIPRGAGLDGFDNYLEFLHPESETVEVRLFMGESPNYKLHVFNIKETAPQSYGLNGLGGAVSVEEQIAKALEKKQLEWELEKTQDKLKRKNKALRRYREDEESKPGISLDGIIEKVIPLLGAIKGVPKELPEAGVSGVEDTGDAQMVGHDSPADKHLAQLKKQFTEKDVLQAVRLAEIFLRNPQLHPQLREILDNNPKKQSNGNL